MVGAQVLHQHVGAGDQLREAGLVLRPGKIERDRFLARFSQTK